MIASAVLQSFLAVGIFFLLLMLCASREFSLEKSLAASGFWTALKRAASARCMTAGFMVDCNQFTSGDPGVFTERKAAPYGRP